MREGERVRLAFSLWAQDIVTSSFAWMRLQTPSLRRSDVTTTRLPTFCRNLEPVGQLWEKTETATCTHNLKKKKLRLRDPWNLMKIFRDPRVLKDNNLHVQPQRTPNRGGPSQSITTESISTQEAKESKSRQINLLSVDGHHLYQMKWLFHKWHFQSRLSRRAFLHQHQSQWRLFGSSLRRQSYT